jgi:hypothetical protein
MKAIFECFPEKRKTPHKCGVLFEAVTTRLELATSGVTGRHSNQLNYATLLREAKLSYFLRLQKSGYKIFIRNNRAGIRHKKNIFIPTINQNHATQQIATNSEHHVSPGHRRPPLHLLRQAY